MNKPTHLLTALILLCFSSWSMAQWQWLDKDGRKVFSDRAPPPDIAEKNILKRPGKVAEPVSAKEDADPSAKPEPATQAAPGKAVDKELEAKKKQAAQAEAAKRKAEQERIQLERADNCTRARQAKMTFESATRIERTNAAGQREVMDDATRASEMLRLNRIIERDCKPLTPPAQ